MIAMIAVLKNADDNPMCCWLLMLLFVKVVVDVVGVSVGGMVLVRAVIWCPWSFVAMMLFNLRLLFRICCLFVFFICCGCRLLLFFLSNKHAKHAYTQNTYSYITRSNYTHQNQYIQEARFCLECFFSNQKLK